MHPGSIDERRGMRLAIANAIQNKSISWTEPVQTYTEMKLTLENRQQRHGSSERLVKVTLFTYASSSYYQLHATLKCHAMSLFVT
jgi:hypothetical protein